MTDQETEAQRGIGPFTLRELILLGIAFVLFVFSFIPVVTINVFGVNAFGYAPVWRFGVISWIPTVGLPVAAAVLLAVRRFSPRVRNVASLSIDQFAAIAFIAAAFGWLQLAFLVSGFGRVLPTAWIAFIVALAGVFFTAFARFVAPFREDFSGREEIPAHPMARPPRPIAAPVRPEPVVAPVPVPPYAGAQQPYEGAQPPYAPQPPYAGAQQPPAEAPAQDEVHPPTSTMSLTEIEQELAASGTAQDGGETALTADVPEQPDSEEDASRTGDPEAAPAEEEAPESPLAEPPSDEPSGDSASDQVTEAPRVDTPAEATAGESQDPEPAAEPAPAQSQPAQQPFWALAPAPRHVYDVNGQPSFMVGPTAWALVLEDRGDVFVIRHDDGRIGFLYDLTGITRG